MHKILILDCFLLLVLASFYLTMIRVIKHGYVGTDEVASNIVIGIGWFILIVLALFVIVCDWGLV